MGKASRKKQKSIKKKGAGVSVGAESAPFGGYATAVAFILIAITTLLIYSNTLHSPFFFDDSGYIVENPMIRDLKSFYDFAGTRYIGILSFALNFHSGGLDVFGYHLVNTLIHVINGFLVYWLVLLTFKTPLMERSTGDTQFKYFVALTSALIFVAHPVQTQAVTYITQRFASLATVFYLLSLTLFVKWRLSNGTLKPGFRTVIYAASVLSAVLAMKTKEISFTLPLTLFIYEFTFFADRTPFKKRLRHLIPFLLTLAIIPLTLLAPELGLEKRYDVTEQIRQTQVEELVALSRQDYLATQFRVIVTYLRLLVLPVGQNVDYDYPLFHSFLDVQVLLSFISLLLILGGAVYLLMLSRKTGNAYGLLASFGICWFFVALSVESSVIPITDVIFEHRLYLPSVGAVIAFTSALFYGLEHTKLKNYPVAIFSIVIFIVLALGGAAYARNLVWKDELRLWEDIVKKSPEKARAHNNLGNVYNNLGRIDDAIEEYKKALRLKPERPDFHSNLGSAYAMQGRFEEAVEEFSEALRLVPDYADAYTNLANIYFTRGDLDEAIAKYKESLRLNPEDAGTHFNLGLAYERKGLREEAVRELNEALKIRPGYEKARKLLDTLGAR